MEQKYRIYTIENGRKFYWTPDFEPTENKAEAELFNEKQIKLFCNDDDLSFEEITEAEKMAALGVPTLPGLE